MRHRGGSILSRKKNPHQYRTEPASRVGRSCSGLASAARDRVEVEEGRGCLKRSAGGMRSLLKGRAGEGEECVCVCV